MVFRAPIPPNWILSLIPSYLYFWFPFVSSISHEDVMALFDYQSIIFISKDIHLPTNQPGIIMQML